MNAAELSDIASRCRGVLAEFGRFYAQSLLVDTLQPNLRRAMLHVLELPRGPYNYYTSRRRKLKQLQSAVRTGGLHRNDDDDDEEQEEEDEEEKEETEDLDDDASPRSVAARKAQDTASTGAEHTVLAVAVTGHTITSDIEAKEYTLYSLLSGRVCEYNSQLREFYSRYRYMNQCNTEILTELFTAAIAANPGSPSSPTSPTATIPPPPSAPPTFPEFPPKKWFGNMNHEFIAGRELALCQYLDALTAATVAGANAAAAAAASAASAAGGVGNGGGAVSSSGKDGLALQLAVRRCKSFQSFYRFVDDPERQLLLRVFSRAFTNTSEDIRITPDEDVTATEDEQTALTLLLLQIVNDEFMSSIDYRLSERFPVATLQNTARKSIMSSIHSLICDAVRDQWAMSTATLAALREALTDQLSRRGETIDAVLVRVVTTIVDVVQEACGPQAAKLTATTTAGTRYFNHRCNFKRMRSASVEQEREESQRNRDEKARGGGRLTCPPSCRDCSSVASSPLTSTGSSSKLTTIALSGNVSPPFKSSHNDSSGSADDSGGAVEVVQELSPRHNNTKPGHSSSSSVGGGVSTTATFLLSSANSNSNNSGGSSSSSKSSSLSVPRPQLEKLSYGEALLHSVRTQPKCTPALQTLAREFSGDSEIKPRLLKLLAEAAKTVSDVQVRNTVLQLQDVVSGMVDLWAVIVSDLISVVKPLFVSKDTIEQFIAENKGVTLKLINEEAAKLRDGLRQSALQLGSQMRKNKRQFGHAFTRLLPNLSTRSMLLSVLDISPEITLDAVATFHRQWVAALKGLLAVDGEMECIIALRESLIRSGLSAMNTALRHQFRLLSAAVHHCGSMLLQSVLQDEVMPRVRPQLEQVNALIPKDLSALGVHVVGLCPHIVGPMLCALAEHALQPVRTVVEAKAGFFASKGSSSSSSSLGSGGGGG